MTSEENTQMYHWCVNAATFMYVLAQLTQKFLFGWSKLAQMLLKKKKAYLLIIDRRHGLYVRSVMM